MGHPGRQGVRRHDARRLPSPRQGAAGQAGPEAPRGRGPGPRAAPLRVPRHATGATASTNTRPYGDVVVSRTGEVLAVRRQARPEEPGAVPEGRGARAEGGRVRRVARLSRARRTPSTRTRVRTSMRTRTDHAFRYRVPSTFPTGDVVFYLYVNFIGDQPSGYAARRGVQGRPPVRVRHEPRRDVPPLRRDLHAPLRPPRDLPEEVPRGRGRRRDRRGPLRRGDRALPRVDGPHRARGRRPVRASGAPTRGRRRSPSRASSSSSTTSRSPSSSSSRGPSARASRASAGANGSPRSTPSSSAIP